MTPAPNKPAIILILALAALGFGWAGVVKWNRPPPVIMNDPNIIFFHETSQKAEQPCPPDSLTFFVIGQSHAANSMLPRTSAESNPQLLNYFNGKCYLLSDPILGPSDRRGSLWPSFAQSLYSTFKKPIVIMSYAAGGTSAKFWRPGEQTIGLMKRAMEDAQRYIKQGGSIDYVIYDQGQMDAMLGTPKAEYAANLKIIFDYVQGELPGDQIFLMFATSWCTLYNPPVPEIIEAQVELAAARSDTHMVFNTDTLDDTYRHDQCHFNEKGRAIIVQKLIAEVLKMQDKN